MNKGTLIFVVMLALAPFASANAQEILETHRTNPAGNCDGARPVDRDALRNRPLALVNEYGSSVSYITCAFTTDTLSLGNAGFGSRFTNLSMQTVTVNCTGVVGEEGAVEYYPKSLMLGPLADGVLEWDGTDTGGLLFDQRVSFSCALPPQVGANDNWVTVVLSIL